MYGPDDSRPQFAKRIAATGVARFLVAFGGLLWTLTASRLLGSVFVGEFYIAFVIVLGCHVLARAGAELALVRSVGRTEDTQERAVLLWRALRRTVIVSAILTSAVYLSRTWLTEVFGAQSLGELLDGMALAILPVAVSAVLASFLRGQARPATAAFFDVGSVLAGSSIWLVIVDSAGLFVGPREAGGVFFLSACIVTAVGLWICWNSILDGMKNRLVHPGSSRADSVGTLLTYIVTEGVSYAQIIGATLIAGASLSSRDLGFLKVGERVAGILGFPQMVVNTVIAPNLARQWVAEDLAALRAWIRRSLLFSVGAALPLYICLLLYLDDVLVLFGKEFIASAQILIILAGAQMINVACGPGLLVLNMSGRPEVARNIVTASSALGLGLMPFLISMWDRQGAALAIGGMMALQNLAAMAVVGSRLWLGARRS